MSRFIAERHHIGAPLSTHWRRASCEEVGCRFWAKGFTVSTLAGPAGDRDAAQIRLKRRGQYTETGNKAGGYDFVFPPGTICLQSSIHRVRLERPEIYVVGRPTQRGVTGQVLRRYDGAESFLDGLHDRIG